MAIVRRPVVDGRREVTGYELIGDGSVLESYPPSELIALAGARTLWLSLDGEVAPELAASGTVVQLRARRRPRAGAGGWSRPASRSRSTATPARRRCSSWRAS